MLVNFSIPFRTPRLLSLFSAWIRPVRLTIAHGRLGQQGHPSAGWRVIQPSLQQRGSALQEAHFRCTIHPGSDRE